MDTPRRGLILATERAIKEYIKDGCEENLPMIRKLESVAYQFWVESNTSFLNESVVTVEEDEEGWMWDEDCVFQSFTAHVEDCLQDDKCISVNLPEDADDTSSICSSIKPCDETDCSFGYLASCEESFSSHASVNICNELYVEDFVEHIENNQPTNRVENLNGVDLPADLREGISAIHDCQRNCICGTDSKERKHVKHESAIINYVDIIGESEENVNISETVESTECELDEVGDEWVVVDNDFIEAVSDNDWFIVSTAEIRGDEHSEKEYNSGNKSHSEIFDISDWAVLSMRVTERIDKDERETTRIDKQTLRESDSLWRNHTKEDLLNDSILGSYGLSTFGGCTLCKSDNDNYKCAIVCVFVQR